MKNALYLPLSTCMQLAVCLQQGSITADSGWSTISDHSNASENGSFSLKTNIFLLGQAGDVRPPITNTAVPLAIAVAVWCIKTPTSEREKD